MRQPTWGCANQRGVHERRSEPVHELLLMRLPLRGRAQDGRELRIRGFLADRAGDPLAGGQEVPAAEQEERAAHRQCPILRYSTCEYPSRSRSASSARAVS